MPARKRIILLIDDEQRQLRLHELVLELSGYTVLTASSGRQGLALLSSCTVDEVLLDYEMPEMDGGKVAASHPATIASCGDAKAERDWPAAFDEMCIILRTNNFVQRFQVSAARIAPLDNPFPTVTSSASPQLVSLTSDFCDCCGSRASSSVMKTQLPAL